VNNHRSILVRRKLENIIGSLIGYRVYYLFKDHFRRAEVRVRIRRHVKMAEEVKKQVKKNGY